MVPYKGEMEGGLLYAPEKLGKPRVSLAYRDDKDTARRQGLRGGNRKPTVGSVFTPCGIKWKQKQQSVALAPDLVP